MIQQSNMKEYDRLVRELNIILDKKRVSYANFATKMGIEAVSFYNKLRPYGFMIDEMNAFLAYAKDMPPNKIKCIKCSCEFIPKAKSVKRALCNDCKEELRRRSNVDDTIKFKYPQWVKAIVDPDIKRLVEQEFHIDEEIAFEMSKAPSLEAARSIRANHWQPLSSYTTGLVSFMTFRS